MLQLRVHPSAERVPPSEPVRHGRVRSGQDTVKLEVCRECGLADSAVARRVVLSEPTLTLQSSNCARSVLSASPLKLISYVSGRMEPACGGDGVRVVTRFRVIWGDDLSSST